MTASTTTLSTLTPKGLTNLSSRDMNKASDDRTSPRFKEIPFNGYVLNVYTEDAGTVKTLLHELLSRRPEAYTIELEEKLLVTENALRETKDKLEYLTNANNIQTDCIERLENAVRTLVPYEQFFHAIISLLNLPAFASTPAPTPTPNGDTNV